MSGLFGRRGAAATPPQPAAPAVPARGADGAASSGVPLPLISYSQETGKFELGAEALRVLKQTRGPVGVVAVCGRARQVSGQERNTAKARCCLWVCVPASTASVA